MDPSWVMGFKLAVSGARYTCACTASKALICEQDHGSMPSTWQFNRCGSVVASFLDNTCFTNDVYTMHEHKKTPHTFFVQHKHHHHHNLHPLIYLDLFRFACFRACFRSCFPWDFHTEAAFPYAFLVGRLERRSPGICKLGASSSQASWFVRWIV